MDSIPVTRMELVLIEKVLISIALGYWVPRAGQG